jgi:hypothetical protein
VRAEPLEEARWLLYLTAGGFLDQRRSVTDSQGGK